MYITQNRYLTPYTNNHKKKTLHFFPRRFVRTDTRQSGVLLIPIETLETAKPRGFPNDSNVVAQAEWNRPCTCTYVWNLILVVGWKSPEKKNTVISDYLKKISKGFNSEQLSSVHTCYFLREFIEGFVRKQSEIVVKIKCKLLMGRSGFLHFSFTTLCVLSILVSNYNITNKKRLNPWRFTYDHVILIECCLEFMYETETKDKMLNSRIWNRTGSLYIAWGKLFQKLFASTM